jgi:hypothetical protein
VEEAASALATASSDAADRRADEFADMRLSSCV